MHEGTGVQPGSLGWRLRDTLAAAFLFLATARWVCWLNTRIAVLWDLGYLLDTAWRIAGSQMPYRDFPLVHPPLTFLIQTGILRAFGRHYALVIAYAALAGGSATILTWRILRRLLQRTPNDTSGWWLSLAMALPLIPLGVYSVYPHPIYDCDCVVVLLFALWLLLRLEGHPRRWPAVLAGAACVLPLFAKQNIGLPFLAAVSVGLALLLAAAAGRKAAAKTRFRPAWILAGIALALASALALIAATAGLKNYLHWTIAFAAQRRMPGLPRLLSVYREPALLWMLPCLLAGLWVSHRAKHPTAQRAGALLLSAPFLGTLLLLLLHPEAPDRADDLLALWPAWLLVGAGCALLHLRRAVSLQSLLPWFVLAAVHGTFLSQQLWGSSYALWPLLLILIATVLTGVPQSVRIVSISAAAGPLFICGALYASSLERLSYVTMPGGPTCHAASPALHGMADPGPYLAHLDELVGFVDRHIPSGDGILALPGEDPLFYATGRVPQFPVTLFDPTTDPYTPEQLFAEARRRRIKWIIFKQDLQIDGSPLSDPDRTMDLLKREFILSQRLSGYDIYKRIEAEEK